MLLCFAALHAQPRTVSDGVYTAAQAKRGGQRYGIYCSSCHGVSLQGGVGGVEQAPALRRDGFMDTRGDLGNLFAYVKAEMPRDEPGTLPDTDYADILAYLLMKNGYPAGSATLPADRRALDHIRTGEATR